METITIDNKVVTVADLPVELQNQIALYEYIDREFLEARKKAASLQLAHTTCSAQIAAAYQKHINPDVEEVTES